MTFTPTELHAIEEAVPAWVAASICIREHNGTFEGDSASDILDRHGVRFDSDPLRYGLIEREVRRRAYESFALTTRQPPRVTARKIPAPRKWCEGCGQRMHARHGERSHHFRRRRFCGRKGRCANRMAA